MIDPERSVALERPARVEPMEEFVRRLVTDHLHAQPVRFPNGSGRFGHPPPLAKQLASASVEFSEPATRRFVRPPTARERVESPRVSLVTVFVFAFAVAFATWFVLRIVA